MRTMRLPEDYRIMTRDQDYVDRMKDTYNLDIITSELAEDRGYFMLPRMGKKTGRYFLAIANGNSGELLLTVPSERRQPTIQEMVYLQEFFAHTPSDTFAVVLPTAKALMASYSFNMLFIKLVLIVTHDKDNSSTDGELQNSNANPDTTNEPVPEEDTGGGGDTEAGDAPEEPHVSEPEVRAVGDNDNASNTREEEDGSTT